MKNAELVMTQEWDKTFPKSDKVNYSKVTFHNRYGITLAADMYVPKDANGKLPAIAVCGPFGAVKDYVAYYKKRAYHKRSLNSNGGWNVTSPSSLLTKLSCLFETQSENNWKGRMEIKTDAKRKKERNFGGSI